MLARMSRLRIFLQAQVEAFRMLHIDVPLSEDFSLSQRQRLCKDA
jgi:hypothetical protein